jgi:hypothetical protein
VSQISIYYHDPVEVDPLTSWTGLCTPLRRATRIDIATVKIRAITELFSYARPDVVISVDGRPVVSIEQTAMNPSGHNIPQRFSFQVRAAEMNVPSILYYPEKSRRTFSDPNVRYLNTRVPLAQKRLSQIYNVPALSSFWPIDSRKLPDTKPSSQKRMADLVSAFVNYSDPTVDIFSLSEVKLALAEMDRTVSMYSERLRKNVSVRKYFKAGISTSETSKGDRIDPPNGAQLEKTSDFIAKLGIDFKGAEAKAIEKKFRGRPYTLVFTGTANKAKSDSEHPWPGYLSLFDILYCRSGCAQSERNINLVYRLPVSSSNFLERINKKPTPPTATHIVDTFADLLILNGGIVAGKPMRGSIDACRI